MLFLRDTSAADLQAVVEFMYRGFVNVTQSQLTSFIKTAEMLQIRGLSAEEDKVGRRRGGREEDRRTRQTDRQTVFDNCFSVRCGDENIKITF